MQGTPTKSPSPNCSPKRIPVMLSAQSQDARTAVACKQLFSLARTPQDMLRLTQPEVAAAIRPAGLFNAKSKNILAASKMIVEKFGGRVPQTHDALMELPGVTRPSRTMEPRFSHGCRA